MSKDKNIKHIVKGLLAITPPDSDITDPLEWAKQTTLLAEQLYELQKLQFELLNAAAPILLEMDSPLKSLLAAHALTLLALKHGGRKMLAANGTEPLSLLESQKTRARDLLASDTDVPEDLRNALLELLGTDEPNDDEAFFPEGGITLPWDKGTVH